MKPLRLWPGVALVTVQWVLALVVPAVAPDAEMFSMPAAAIGIVGGTICGVAVLLWWLFFSRAAWIERVAAPLVILLALLLTRALAHESIVGAHMGYSLYLLPTVGWSMALVAWAALTQHMSRAARVAALVVAVAVAFLPWLLMRTAGVMGAGSEYHWRWTPTPEELLLARGDHFITPPAPDAAASREVVPPPAAQAEAEPDAPAAPRAETAVMSPVPSANARAPVSAEARTLPSPHSGRPIAWPGFRGPQRDSIVRGVVISTDWSASPPLEMWRRAIGPGWSSFTPRNSAAKRSS
jgi:outer membrane protein assembly factor BamB